MAANKPLHRSDRDAMQHRRSMRVLSGPVY
jgi:hypothetical protein